ncbi:MAG: hypothetical protein K0S32_3295 [Bacteroidetes bacterium]|jgi:hypothetical protein|nr:hypothetical protein [Bacteroidota bacterium]
MLLTNGLRKTLSYILRRKGYRYFFSGTKLIRNKKLLPDYFFNRMHTFCIVDIFRCHMF